MRCLSCHKLSLKVICNSCTSRLLIANPTRRKIGTLEVVSLFSYENMERFILTKHTPVGHRVYRHFAKEFTSKFLDSFANAQDEEILIVGVDERVKSGYSHTALLCEQTRSKKIKVAHSKLLSTSDVKYAGKTLQYRIEHPRKFIYKGPTNLPVVLVDDIVTTGMTLIEADTLLRSMGAEVLFALTLADANR